MVVSGFTRREVVALGLIQGVDALHRARDLRRIHRPADEQVDAVANFVARNAVGAR